MRRTVRSARAWSQKTIGGCWERQSEEDENIDPGARCHCVDAPAAQTHSSGGFTEAVSRSESASCRFIEARPGSALFARIV